MSKTPNPFYHRTPIQDPAYFFGRAQERQRIVNLIRHGQSVSLIGPRRIGKSSLLAQLGQVRHSADHGLVAEAQIMVYFDGAAWQDQSPHALYAAFWSAIAHQLTSHPTGGPHVQDLPHVAEAELDFPSFQRALRQLHAAGRTIVLLLDEFDALSRNRHLDEVFFSSLRSLATGQGMVFVTASTRPLLELTYAQQSALSSPFFNIFLPQRLGLLSDAAAHELLIGTAALGGVTLTPSDVEWLLTLAGPHPCYLQIAGYHFCEAQRADHDTRGETDQQAFLAEVTPHWSYQWHYLTIEEQRAMALLTVQQPGDPVLQQRLLQTCLVQSGTELALLSPTLQTFIRRQPIHQMRHAGPLLIDEQRKTAWLAGVELTLSPQDYRLLTALATEAGKNVTYEALAQQLWPEEKAAINQQQRLKTAVNSLRRKLGAQEAHIATDSNNGYRFVPEI